jgi:hypothetical protein
VLGKVQYNTNSNIGIGVKGEGGFYGVLGVTDDLGQAGIGGYSNGQASGAEGFSTTGHGVAGIATGDFPGGFFYNNSTGAGVSAESADSTALTAIAYNDAAIYAVSDMHEGIFAESNLGNQAGSFLNNKNNGIGLVAMAKSVGLRGEVLASTQTFSAGVFGITANAGANHWAGYFNGALFALSSTAGVKAFTIDHPLDPANKILRHSSVESPDMMNIYNGNITTDANGNATIILPDYFMALNQDFKYQLTVIDNSADFVMAKITEELSNNKFTIKSSKANVKVSWQITGVRKDATANANRIVVEEDKPATLKGKYFDAAAFGLSAEYGMDSFVNKTKENLNNQASITAENIKQAKKIINTRSKK